MQKSRLARPWRRLRELARASWKSASVVRQVPLHIAGLGCIDFAAFHVAHALGWLVTGASLIWLEHVLAGDE